MRKVAIVTGTRAEYGLFVPILRAIEKSRRLDYRLYVTGMHLSGEFGLTVDHIKRDGFNVAAAIDALNSDDTGSGMAMYAGHLTAALSKEFERDRPDVVLVLGDRGEMLSAALVANCMNIPVAHIHGGEVSGSVDDGFRHAITKLAHVHFPATKGSAERIRKMGEEAWRIKVVGAPGLDGIIPKAAEVKAAEKKMRMAKREPLILVAQHSVIQQKGSAREQMRATLEAVAATGHQAILIYPNADPGGREMIKVIEQFVSRHHRIKAFKSLKRAEYLCLLALASVMVGNSSSGIIEAPTFKLPVVNVGTRQRGRERACNVIDAPHDSRAIQRAIQRALGDVRFRAMLVRCRNPYGDGRASERIVDALSELKIDERLLHKRMRY